MAKMIPQQWDTSLDKKMFEAEEEVYSALKSQLGSEYTVIHSCSWVNRHSIIPYEIDFIILSSKGVIALEVKGGGIETGSYNKVEKGYRQAYSALEMILSFYRQRAGTDFPFSHHLVLCFPGAYWQEKYGQGLLTRKNVIDQSDMKALLPKIEQVYYHQKEPMSEEDMELIKNILKPDLEIPLSLSYLLQKQQERMEQYNVFQDYLLDIFENKPRAAFKGAAGTGKTWLALKKAHRLAQEGKEVLLTCYNESLAEFMKQKTAGIKGITVLYFHQLCYKTFGLYLSKVLDTPEKQSNVHQLFFDLFAHSLLHNDYSAFLALKDKDFKALLLMSAQQKQQILDRYIPKIDAIILNFVQELFSASDKLAGQMPEAPEKKSGNFSELYYNDILPLPVELVLEKLPHELKFDAILCDESQDFKDLWVFILEKLYKNPADPVFYCFYDVSQNLYGVEIEEEKLKIKSLLKDPHSASSETGPLTFSLLQNLRNTKEIYDYARKTTGIGDIVKSELQAQSKAFEPKESLVQSAQLRTYLAELLTHLIEKNQIRPEQICILSNVNLSSTTSVFNQNPLAGKYHLTAERNSARLSQNHIRYRTINDFKGLESDIVISLIYNRTLHLSHNPQKLIYVGFTRAKYFHHVIWVGNKKPDLLAKKEPVKKEEPTEQNISENP